MFEDKSGLAQSPISLRVFLNDRSIGILYGDRLLYYANERVCSALLPIKRAKSLSGFNVSVTFVRVYEIFTIGDADRVIIKIEKPRAPSKSGRLFRMKNAYLLFYPFYRVYPWLMSTRV